MSDDLTTWRKQLDAHLTNFPGEEITACTLPDAELDFEFDSGYGGLKMSNVVVQQIAEILHSGDGQAVWPWGHSQTDRERYLAMAGVLAARLNLHEERRVGQAGDEDERELRRWVSDWTVEGSQE